MTKTEFDEFGLYLSKLWPSMALNDEQRDLWWIAMRSYELNTSRSAAAEVYKRAKYASIKPHEIIEQIRIFKRSEMGIASLNFAPEYVAQVSREESEEAALIADWTEAEREAGRREIISNEAGMGMLLDKCPLRGPMLTHFLVERYIYGRTTIYVGKVSATSCRGAADVIHMPTPQQLPVAWRGY